MEPKPSELVLAVMQFLEILVPGALITYFGLGFAGQKLFAPGAALPDVGDAGQRWVAFFIASYVLGHFVFLLASFLDSFFYDPLRKRFRPVKQDQTFQKADAIRIAYLGDPRGEIVNTFKWTKAILNLQAPGSITEIRRHETDSKFFRSLVIVFACSGLVELMTAQWLRGLAFLVFAGLSLWRYYDQRWKSTQLAYQYLIAIQHLRESAASAGSERSTDEIH